MKARILPFIEQSALFNALNMGFTYTSAQQFTVAITNVNGFVCPSDGNQPSPTATLGSVTATVGATSYPNNIGTFIGNNFGQHDGPAYSFPTTSNSYGPLVTFAAVTDGAVEYGDLQRIRQGQVSDKLGGSGPGVLADVDHVHEHDDADQPRQRGRRVPGVDQDLPGDGGNQLGPQRGMVDPPHVRHRRLLLARQYAEQEGVLLRGADRARFLLLADHRQLVPSGRA